MTLSIGNHKLEAPVILAPMSGITDRPFRKIVRSFGAPLLVTEMIASKAMIFQTRQSMQKCELDDDGLTSVQLAGCNPEDMSEAAKLNEDLGAKIIDINFGCPAKKVINGYSGSYLMKDEIKAAKILEATVKAVKIPVTLKMRTGWDMNSRNAPILAKIAEDTGIKMITIHGRTRCQFYTGISDWDFVKQVKDVVKIPIIVNGDIKNIQDAVTAMEKSGADGLMVGRGAYGKPWIINQISHYLKTGEIIPDPTPQERISCILQHLEEMLSLYGEHTGVMMYRKHMGWYSSGLPNSSAFRAKINTMHNPKEIKKEIYNIFN
jgi:tRNA-dihydrouridine synthase B